MSLQNSILEISPLRVAEPDSKQMKYCCGIQVLYDLGYCGYQHCTAPTQAEVEKFLKDSSNLKKTGLLIAATRNNAQPAAIAALNNCGFQPLVDNFYNPNSENNVTLWGKLINQPEPPKLEAAPAQEPSNVSF